MNAHENNNRLPGGFTAEIATDLSSGRVVDLAEVYALNAVDDAERAAIEQFLASAPAADRDAFNERVRQARETLATSFTAEEEPPRRAAGPDHVILAAQTQSRPQRSPPPQCRCPARVRKRRRCCRIRYATAPRCPPPTNSVRPASAGKNAAARRACGTGLSASPPQP